MEGDVSGLLLLDKPAGVTSYDCVHQVKRKLQVKRVGHCGTLDPLAKGLLLILVGPATRAQDSFLDLEKQYWFQGEFGRKTSTGDREGEQVAEGPWRHLTPSAVTEILDTFVGTSLQTPPLYSALKFKGKPYYAYARQGLSVPRIPRSVHIGTFSLLSLSLPYWEARVTCSRGTYVRTLVEDVGERLGTCATLAELVRERIGSYQREDAMSWEALRVSDSESLRAGLKPVSSERPLAHV